MFENFVIYLLILKTIENNLPSLQISVYLKIIIHEVCQMFKNNICKYMKMILEKYKKIICKQ